MKKTAILVLCSLGALSAGAQSPAGGEAGVDSMLGVTPSTEEFVKKVAISDMFEIQSSQLAAEKGDAKAKAFAQHMIADHKKTAAELQGLIKTGAVQLQPPTGLDSAHQSDIEKLNRESGTDFTRTYDEDQVSAHKDAVSLFGRYAKGGDNPQLKDWAGKTLPALQQHLQMAQELTR